MKPIPTKAEVELKFIDLLSSLGIDVHTEDGNQIFVMQSEFINRQISDILEAVIGEDEKVVSRFCREVIYRNNLRDEIRHRLQESGWGKKDEN